MVINIKTEIKYYKNFLKGKYKLICVISQNRKFLCIINDVTQFSDFQISLSVKISNNVNLYSCELLCFIKLVLYIENLKIF